MNRSPRFCLLSMLTLPLLLSACEEDLPPLPKVPPATQPAPQTRSVSIEPPCKPPHGGRLLPMPDNRGYVEWAVDTGRLYFLDDTCKALTGAGSVVLTIRTGAGPRQVPLSDCGEPEYPRACWTNPAGELRQPDAGGIIRFLVNGEAVRVSLAARVRTQSPADLEAPVPSQTRASP
jgi:hypothetical protein